MTATEAKMMDEFDPSVVTADQVVALDKRQCTAVLKHYNMPTPPAKWKLDEFRKMALASVMAHATAPEAPEPEPAPVDEVPPAVVPDPEKPGLELEAHRPDAVVVFPEASKWQQIKAMAVDLAKSSLVPKALQDKPEDVMIILLAANDLGIPLTQALDKIFVINGRKGQSAELMLALARRDGHKLVPGADNDETVAWIHCHRRDTGEDASISFTIDEAVRAKLVSIDKDGVPRKKDAKGNPQPWELFTADMLWARVVARAMRRMFSDCLAGVSYIPDELGYIDADNDPPKSTAGRHGEATVTLNERREKLSQRAAGLAKDEKTLLVEEWRKKRYPVTMGTGPENPARPDFTALVPAVITAIDRFIDGLIEARGPVADEAETVEGSDSSDPVPGEAEAGEATPEAGSGPLNRETGTEGSESGVSPADAGSIPSEGQNGTSNVSDVVDVPELCEGCGEPFEDADTVVEGVDGGRYHAGHEPM